MGAALFLAPGVAHAVTLVRRRQYRQRDPDQPAAGLSLGRQRNLAASNQSPAPAPSTGARTTSSKPNENKAPPFYIRFDSDTSAKRYIEPWKLTGRAAVEQLFELGNKYALRYDGPSRRYIEIFDVPG